MKLRANITTIFILSSFILLIHVLGLKFYYYWQFGWYDWVVHFLGGALVFLIVHTIFVGRRIHEPHHFHLTLLLLALVFVISIGWEIYELYIGAVYAPFDTYIIDTWIDITMGLLGAGVALVLVNKSESL